MSQCPICGHLFETGISMLIHRFSDHVSPLAKLSIGSLLVGLLLYGGQDR